MGKAFLRVFQEVREDYHQVHIDGGVGDHFSLPLQKSGWNQAQVTGMNPAFCTLDAPMPFAPLGSFDGNCKHFR